MKRVCLFGGTFDPPHLGHITMAESVIERLGVDEVWFIPTYLPPLKKREVTPSHHRLEMLKRLLRNKENFKIETIELERKGKSYTIDTIQTLRSRYPNVIFYFLIGADQVAQLHRWHRIEELMTLIRFIGVERPGYSWDSSFKVERIPAPKVDISSTEIRNMLKAGEKVGSYVPEEVYSYIKEHRLYGYGKNEENRKGARLSNERYAHTLRVVEVAKALAERFHVAKEPVVIAALFHDFQKDIPPERLKQLIKEYELPPRLLSYHHELWHGPVAAKKLELEYGIEDLQVLKAIYYHTTGRACMTEVELVIFVADYIEPGRSFPGVDRVRRLAEQDLYLVAYQALKQTITYLVERENIIHPDTFEAYNDLTKKLGVK